MNASWKSRVPVLRDVIRYYCAPDWRWDRPAIPHWTEVDAEQLGSTFTFWTVLQGTGHLTVSGQGYPLRAGDAFVLRRDQACRGRHEGDRDPLVVLALYFHLLDDVGHIQLPDDLRWHHRRFEEPAFFFGLQERAEAAWHQNDNGAGCAWLNSALHEVVDKAAPSTRAPLDQQQHAMIDQLCREIRLYPERHYDIGELARRVHYSRQHFTRCFRHIQGMSPRTFITETRLTAAKTLLQASNYPMARIAELTGFSDPYFFSRQFHRHTGLTPSQYRRGRI